MTRDDEFLFKFMLVTSVITVVLTVVNLWLDSDPEKSNVEPNTKPSASAEPVPPTAAAEGTYHPVGRRQLLQLLDQVAIVDVRPDVPGYDRECGTGHACSFGTDWSDNVDVPGGHNGCDTRNDILTRDLTRLVFRPDTNNCVVESGDLADPYTGTRIRFRKETAYEVGLDHVYPLALGWDMGASTWTEDRRRDFANDPINLIAVSGSANSSKGDSSPAEWMPINTGYRCTYVAGFLKVAIAYDLPITTADQDAVTAIAPSCRPSGGAR